MCTSRSVRFSSAVDTRQLPGESRCDDDAKADLWYSRKELSRLMQDLAREVKLLCKERREQELMEQQPLDQETSQQSPTIRGIEHLINKTVSKRRKAVKESVITWVLTEQDRQREHGVSNPNIIANMSMLLSLEHMKDATKAAQCDEEYVKFQSIPQQVEISSPPEPTQGEGDVSDEFSFSSWISPTGQPSRAWMEERDPTHFVEAILQSQDGYLPVVATTAPMEWEESSENSPLLNPGSETSSVFPKRQRDVFAAIIRSSFMTYFANDGYAAVEVEDCVAYEYTKMREQEPGRKWSISFRGLQNKKGVYDFVPFDNKGWDNYSECARE